MTIKVFCVVEDLARAERVVVALMNAGLDVQLQGLDGTAQQGVLSGCRVALFCWSESAMVEDAAYFRGLAQAASDKNIAIGVGLDAHFQNQDDMTMTLYLLRPWQLGPHNWVMRLLIGDLFLSDVVTAARSKLAGLDPPPAVAHSQY